MPEENDLLQKYYYGNDKKNNAYVKESYKQKKRGDGSPVYLFQEVKKKSVGG